MPKPRVSLKNSFSIGFADTFKGKSNNTVLVHTAKPNVVAFFVLAETTASLFGKIYFSFMVANLVTVLLQKRVKTLSSGLVYTTCISLTLEHFSSDIRHP